MRSKEQCVYWEFHVRAVLQALPGDPPQLLADLVRCKETLLAIGDFAGSDARSASPSNP